MSEHMSLVCGRELHDNLFVMLSQPHIILAINCVYASNWFTHLQPTLQIDGQNDNSVNTVAVVNNSPVCETNIYMHNNTKTY